MSTLRKIIIPQNEFIHIVDTSDILYCQADNYYTHVFLCEGKQFLLVKSLAKLEREMEDPNFIRVNQSYLVNKGHIKNIHKKSKSLHLTNNLIVPYTVTLKQLMKMISFS